MSDFDTDERKVAAWLMPLADEAAPCGPDLEYDNDFLSLSQAAAGKPESQFGAAEAPDWRSVADQAEPLLDRSRDLRIALLWLRARLHLAGYGALPAGLGLMAGLVDQHWNHVHPQPDPDDGDPYARVNLLSSLRETDGLVGDLRESRLIQDRAIGELAVRSVAVALGQMVAAEGQAHPGKDQIGQMLRDALAKTPQLRQHCEGALTQLRRLMSLTTEKLGSDAAPDLRPLYSLVQGVVSMLPSDQGSADGAPDGDAADGSGTVRRTGGTADKGLSGSVNSREDAVRAIDLICAYLERAEPTNPAPLFLKRARQLIGQNFLQLIKALAPESLAGVAGMVGIDPDAIESPQ